MRFKNNLSLFHLICVIGFTVGFFQLIASIGYLIAAKHVASKWPMYLYCASAPFIFLPLLISGFHLRTAWGVLLFGIILMTVSGPILVMSGGSLSVRLSAAMIIVILGLCTILILCNQTIRESVKRKPTKTERNFCYLFFFIMTAVWIWVSYPKGGKTTKIIVAKIDVEAGVEISKDNLAFMRVNESRIPKYQVHKSNAAILFGHHFIKSLKRGEPVTWYDTDIPQTNSPRDKVKE